MIGVKVNFLTYNAVKLALKNYKLKRENKIDFDSPVFTFNSGAKINILHAKCKHYYEELVSCKKEAPSVLQFWNNVGITTDSVLASLPQIRSSTKEVKLIAFQYKIINNIVANNNNLNKWGIKPSKLCSFCDESDTLFHMFSSCPKSYDVLKTVLKELKIRTFNLEEFLLGPFDKAKNIIFVIIKMAIWKSRFHGDGTVNPNQIIQEIILRITADQSSLSPHLFTTKWTEFKFLLNTDIVRNT